MYRNIVCGVSRAGTGVEAATRAAEMAKLTGATLHVVHAFAGPAKPGVSARPGEPHGRQEAESFLAGQWGSTPGVRTHALPGDPAAAVLQVAREQGADLVVVGNLGIDRRFLSSVPTTIVREAPCDVLVVATA
jgi:nucleotide-binding universal stress UspA family protein